MNPEDKRQLVYLFTTGQIREAGKILRQYGFGCDACNDPKTMLQWMDYAWENNLLPTRDEI